MPLFRLCYRNVLKLFKMQHQSHKYIDFHLDTGTAAVLAKADPGGRPRVHPVFLSDICCCCANQRVFFISSQALQLRLQKPTLVVDLAFILPFADFFTSSSAGNSEEAQGVSLRAAMAREVLLDSEPYMAQVCLLKMKYMYCSECDNV